MTFRPKLTEHTIQELHRLAFREGRTLTNMTEIALRTGLRAMQNLPRPWESAPATPTESANRK
jgi:hypothetical protein